MMLRQCFYFGLAIVLLVATAAPSWALSEDLTFSTDPVSLGWTQFFLANSWLNTAAGEWQVTAAAGDRGRYVKASIPAALANSVHYGQAEITHTTFGSVANVTIADFRSTSLGAELSYSVLDGNISVSGGRLLDVSNGFSAKIPVANQDGLEHTYGYEIDTTVAGNFPVKFFFDDLPVGDVGGYNAYSPYAVANGPFEWYNIGDGTKGTAHTEVWDRYQIQPGAYPVIPEPATMWLLGLGLLGLLSYRCRK